MNKRIHIALLVMFATIVLVAAGDFNFNYQGDRIFTVGVNGSVGAINLSVSEMLAVTQNISAESFIGDGSYLTGITIDSNSTEISYHNITDIPTCGVNEFLDFDGTDLSCDSLEDNSTEISYHNITDIPTCGVNEFLDFDGTDLSCDSLEDNSTEISYHNITDIPTCGAGDYLTFDGTDLSCDTPTGLSDDYANISISNTFAEEQNFSKFINVTEGIRMMEDTTAITRDGVDGVNITIDSSGNINFNLG